jgi:hypothetical protein
MSASLQGWTALPIEIGRDCTNTSVVGLTVIVLLSTKVNDLREGPGVLLRLDQTPRFCCVNHHGASVHNRTSSPTTRTTLWIRLGFTRSALFKYAILILYVSRKMAAYISNTLENESGDTTSKTHVSLGLVIPAPEYQWHGRLIWIILRPPGIFILFFPTKLNVDQKD